MVKKMSFGQSISKAKIPQNTDLRQKNKAKDAKDL